jgi:antitoxin (DNA-binding transcriptional repressor) of toxin-antitoxin stability system
MRAVDIGLFEHLFEELIDEVAKSGEPVAITKDGEPMAKLAPFAPVRQSLWGAHKGQIEILGDLLAPIDVEWDADR